MLLKTHKIHAYTVICCIFLVCVLHLLRAYGRIQQLYNGVECTIAMVFQFVLNVLLCCRAQNKNKIKKNCA